MAEQITLSAVGSLIDTTTAQTAINNNFATIEEAFTDVLSLSGTAPNQMQAVLDMNSNQIINLPVPSTMNSPARLIDVVSNPTIVVPGTGTSGHVVPFLDGNNTWSGTNTYSNSSVFNGSVALNGTVTGLTFPAQQGWQNNYSSKTSTYTVLPTDNGATIGLSGNTFYSINFNAASTYPTDFVVMICNEDSYPGGRGKTVSMPGNVFILYPGQNVLIFVRNAATPAWDYHPKSQLWRQGGITFYVDNAGSDSNDGLATGSGAFATFQAAASAAYYNCDTAGSSTNILGTAGQTFAQQLNLGGVPFGSNLLVIGSTTSSPFIWATPVGGGTMISVGDHSQLALSNITFQSNNSVFGQAACYLHNDGLIDFGVGITFKGGGSNDTAIFADNNDCIFTVGNGFTCTGIFGDLIHFDGGGAATISGSITPTGTTTVGQFIHLKAKARATFGTQPVTTGYFSIGTSVVETQSLLLLSGITIPGGTSTATGGLIV